MSKWRVKLDAYIEADHVDEAKRRLMEDLLLDPHELGRSRLIAPSHCRVYDERGNLREEIQEK